MRVIFAKLEKYSLIEMDGDQELELLVEQEDPGRTEMSRGNSAEERKDRLSC